MLAKKKTTTKKKIIYAVVIAAMFLGNGIYYYNNFMKDKSSPSSATGPAANISDTLKSKKAKEIVDKQKSILDHELFNQLKKTGDWPVEPVQVGRANPFLPYFEQ